MKAVFILSTGRTGTKLIADYFAGEGKNVLSLHEPRFSRHFRILSNLHTMGKIGKHMLLGAFRKTRTQLFNQEVQYSHYIESNNFLYGYAPLFKELFDDYIVVHVIRDPRDYIRSHINHGVFQGAKLLAKLVVPYWFMNVKKVIKTSEKLNDLETLAARWVIVNRYLSERSEKENYLLVKFEDIVKGSGMAMICEKTGLPFNKEQFNQIAGKKVNKGQLDLLPHWSSWSAADCKAVHAICGDYMRQFDYGQEAEWIKKINE